jgi:MOSC domain-containing protein YiiM
MELRLLSVNVGRPEIIGERNGAPLRSAFRKTPVTSDEIGVHPLGLDGDQQANLLVHGGRDKAVYAYPADHWSWWEGDQRLACRPAAFGENLTLEGADETQVRIGDRFCWGEAVLEVSQPRSPCHKLQRVSGRQDVSELMIASGRCGWYLRVISEAMAPTRDAHLRRLVSGKGPTVRESFLAVFDRSLDDESRARIARTPALADAWRQRLA